MCRTGRAICRRTSGECLMVGHRTGGGAVSVARVAGVVAIEAARRSFLASGHCLAAEGGVRAEVLASWQRSRRHGVDPDRVTARFAGHPPTPSLATACAEEVFDDFFKLNGEVEGSLIL